MTLKKVLLVVAWIAVAWIIAANVLYVFVEKEELPVPMKVLGFLCLFFIIWRAAVSNK